MVSKNRRIIGYLTAASSAAGGLGGIGMVGDGAAYASTTGVAAGTAENTRGPRIVLDTGDVTVYAAASGLEDCPASRFCIWENRNFNLDADGGMIAFNASDSNYTNNSWPQTTDGINDEVSSWYNRENVDVWLRQEASCNDGQFTIASPGEKEGDITDSDPGQVGDNEASAHCYQ
jgi:hypothetical protein